MRISQSQNRHAPDLHSVDLKNRKSCKKLGASVPVLRSMLSAEAEALEERLDGVGRRRRGRRRRGHAEGIQDELEGIPALRTGCRRRHGRWRRCWRGEVERRERKAAAAAALSRILVTSPVGERIPDGITRLTEVPGGLLLSRIRVDPPLKGGLVVLPVSDHDLPARMQSDAALITRQELRATNEALAPQAAIRRSAEERHREQNESHRQRQAWHKESSASC
mmetsp:Transcript_14026/g.38588  ORF Transcript_14026/g.38588 Transcript_14026/m.38588 type:complete len:222 (-) Transcript_14026:115-780(-)